MATGLRALVTLRPWRLPDADVSRWTAMIRWSSAASGRGCSVAKSPSRARRPSSSELTGCGWLRSRSMTTRRRHGPRTASRSKFTSISLWTTLTLPRSKRCGREHASPSFSRPLNTGEFSLILLAIPSVSLLRPERWSERRRRVREGGAMGDGVEIMHTSGPRQ